MKALNKQTGQLEKVYVKALDSMPVGTVVEFNGQASDIPSGWEQVSGENKIRKVSLKTPTSAHIVDGYSTSTTDGYSCNEVNNLVQDVYSTDEVKTNKVWIDGKPIYRKVVEYTMPSTVGNYPTVDTGILNAENMFITIERQYGTDNSQYVSAITGYNGYFEKSNGIFTFNRTNTDATKADAGIYNIILEYTKTTD